MVTSCPIISNACCQFLALPQSSGLLVSLSTWLEVIIHHVIVLGLPFSHTCCPHRSRIKAPIILQNIVDPILIVATPARSPAAPGIGTSLGNLVATCLMCNSLRNFHPVGCNPNDTRMTVTYHMGYCVLVISGPPGRRFQRISIIYTILSFNCLRSRHSQRNASKFVRSRS